jgi:archaellum biogenesis ATPase FlaH
LEGILEAKILGALLHERKAFEELTNLKEDGAGFTDAGKIIFSAIAAYYRRDPAAGHVDKGILLAALEQRLNNEKQFNRISEIVKGLAGVSVLNLVDVYRAQKKYIIANELAAALLKQDDAKVRDLSQSWAAWDVGVENKTEESADVYEDIAIESVLAPLKRENLLPLFPSSLNELTDGGATKGDHILIAGRVENGKSLFAINLAAGLCYSGKRVLYIGNEDAPARMLPRFVSRLTGLTKQQIMQDYKGTQEKANKRGLNNLIFINARECSLNHIDNWLSKYKPDTVVVDQIRNINAGNVEKTEQLEKVATGVRRLIKKHNVLGISVSQSMNDSEHINKLIGDMADVANSKVDLPGQADLLILLGTNDDYRNRNMVMLSIPKNKLSGWHGSYPVRINPLLSMVEDVA